MAYVKTAWVNDSAPAVNATNLNKIETGIYDAHVTADAAIPKSIFDAAGDLLYASGADTPARLAIGATGKVLSGGATPSWLDPPAKKIAYGQVTADTSTASTTDVDLFTFPAGTFEAAEHYCRVVIPLLRHSASVGNIFFNLKEGATVIGNIVQFDAHYAAGNGVPLVVYWRFTPTAGSHTYKITWRVGSGTGTVRTTSLIPAEFWIGKV